MVRSQERLLLRSLDERQWKEASRAPVPAARPGLGPEAQGRPLAALSDTRLSTQQALGKQQSLSAAVLNHNRAGGFHLSTSAGAKEAAGTACLAYMVPETPTSDGRTQPTGRPSGVVHQARLKAVL